MENPGQQPPVAASSGGLKPDMVLGSGRFRLKRILGQGGMGLVWLAHDLRLQEPVALKFLPPQVALDASTLLNLRRETLRSRKLSHPNIIRIHDFIEVKGEPPFISMEYVDGPNFHDLRERRPLRVLRWDFLAPLVRQLCAALDYAHGENIIHRDLKPANLMLDSAGRLRLADFGLARVAPGAVTQQTGVTLPGGTLDFMSPQQADGKAAQVADDIYSLGATLYDLLTSRPPFYEGDIAYQLRNTRPDPLPQRLLDLGLSNEIPSEVSALVMACLAKEPERRPSSAKAILEFLEGAEKEREKARQELFVNPAPIVTPGTAPQSKPRIPIKVTEKPLPANVSPLEDEMESEEEMTATPVPHNPTSSASDRMRDKAPPAVDVLEEETESSESARLAPLERTPGRQGPSTLFWTNVCICVAIVSGLGGVFLGKHLATKPVSSTTAPPLTTSKKNEPIQSTAATPGQPAVKEDRPLPIPAPSISASYDLYDAFSGLSNPNGVWSFGWKQTLHGPFTLLPVIVRPFAENNLQLQGWGLTITDPPTVLCNRNMNPAVLAGATAICPMNSVWFTAGTAGRQENFGVVRFTVPAGAAGSYQITCTARSFWQQAGPYATEADFHVLVNGAEVLSQLVSLRNPFMQGTTRYLYGGETVDFMIGRGPDGKSPNACLFLQATISRQRP